MTTRIGFASAPVMTVLGVIYVVFIGFLAVRWSFAAYGVLGLTSAVGHAIGNDTMTLVGFAAWGFVLYVATGLIAVHFKRLSTHTPA